MKICESCKFYKSTTKSCGTLLFGRGLTPSEVEELKKENLITYYKKKIRLCGCVLPLKTLGIFESCPVGKWGVDSITKDQLKELIQFVDDLPQYGVYKVDHVKELNRWLQIVTGSKQNIKTCPSCVRDMVRNFRRQINKYKKELKQEEENAITNPET